MGSPAEEPRSDPQVDSERRSSPAAESVGDLLRRTRESYGQDVSAVAMQLRIRSGYLRAIEEGRFKDLPGSAYAVGFVRTYAEYLGLDAQEVLRRFREEVAEVSGQTQLVFPAATAEGKFPGGAILMLSLLLAAVAYGGWYYISDREGGVLSLIPAVPERFSALVSGDAPPPETEQGDLNSAADEAVAGIASSGPDEASWDASGSDPSESAVTPVPAPASLAQPSGAAEGAEEAATDSAAPELPQPQRTAAASDPASSEPVSPDSANPDSANPASTDSHAARSESATPESASPESTGLESGNSGPAQPAPEPGSDAGEPAAAADAGAASTVAAIPAAPTAPEASDSAQTFGAANTESRIVLHARLESWVQVTDASNTPLLTRVLRAGDRYQVPNAPGLTLATGNAGGLDIVVDGRAVPSLGPVGVVRRGIVLDAERLIAGTALAQ